MELVIGILCVTTFWLGIENYSHWKATDQLHARIKLLEKRSATPGVWTQP